MNLHFITHDGKTQTITGKLDQTLMEAAVQNGINGIAAECGGACACATCHCYIDANWQAIVGKPASMEEDMLDFASDVRPNSRLSCQITLTSAMDGLTITLPENQG
jgi:ferredoxin, 2Fe-2S